MSALLVDELYPGVTFAQPFKITRDISVAHIRPWIYKHGALQDGEFQCQVKEGTTVLATVQLTAAEVNAGFTETYAHGFIRFDFASLALRIPEGATEKEYVIEYTMQNHTKDAGNFIGIVRRWEKKTYPTYGSVDGLGEALNDSIEPSGLELFEYKAI